MSYRYWDGPAGLRFCYAKDPTYRCPNADPVTYTPSSEEQVEGVWTIARPELKAAAAAIGADPLLLGKLLRQRHASHQAGRLRVDGKLTDRCAICGTRMTRKGFRAWIDEPDVEDRSGVDIAQRLGMGAPVRTIRVTWHKTKRQAMEWARHERDRASK